MRISALLGLYLVFFSIFVPMKRKKVDNRNENRKLKRRVAALMKKELAVGRAEYAKVMRVRERKTNSRLNKFRKSIKER